MTNDMAPYGAAHVTQEWAVAVELTGPRTRAEALLWRVREFVLDIVVPALMYGLAAACFAWGVLR